MNLYLIFCALTASATSSFITQEFVSLEPYSPLHHDFSSIGNYYDSNSVVQKSAQLANLARSSALNAKNAVHNQHSAGSHAEFGVKSTLANVAAEASKAAQAAFTGKQAIFSNIKQQVISTHNQLKDEIAQYQQAAAAAHAAREAAHKAQAQLHSFRATLSEAEGTAHDSSVAADEAGSAEAAQKAMVFEAKQRLELLIHQLKNVGGDLKDIKVSAIKANKAAQVASTNAVNAGYKKQIGYGYGYHV